MLFIQTLTKETAVVKYFPIQKRVPSYGGSLKNEGLFETSAMPSEDPRNS